MKYLSMVAMAILAGSLAAAQTIPKTAAPPQTAEDYSGMYTFLKEGEFVQLTVEDGGQVTGFVSRYGDEDSDKGTFLDQFFKQAKLEGKKLTFTTQTVHGVWYEFKGAVERAEGKNVGDEAYYVLKGKLTIHKTDPQGRVTAQAHEVVFKAFPPRFRRRASQASKVAAHCQRRSARG
jgi:hypothetical protein